MKDYQREFIEFALENKVLIFGDFQLKSGRHSPYFFNAGLFYTGQALSKLGYFYAAALSTFSILILLEDHLFQTDEKKIDLLFGPAYKGIPLVTAASMELYKSFGINLPIAYNRKEAKDHGEGGRMVGAPLHGKLWILDDVMTAGTGIQFFLIKAIREVVSLLKPFENAQLSGVLIALDREEKGLSELSAVEQIQQDFGIPVLSIIKLSDIIIYLEQKGEQEQVLKMKQYREKYKPQSK